MSYDQWKLATPPEYDDGADHSSENVHYITPKPAPGTRFVKAFGLSTGFDMPMRAVSVYERDQPELEL